MLFAKQLEDSSPEKIRKSIFIFASIVLFVVIYQLKITAPSSIFQGASGEVNISNNDILFIVMIIQTYLLSRLIVSWKVSKAVFEKTWIIDEFEFKDDNLKLLNELNRFNEYWKDRRIDYPSTNLNIDKEFQKVLSTQEDFHNVLSQNQKVLGQSNKDIKELKKLLTHVDSQVRTVASHILTNEQTRNFLSGDIDTSSKDTEYLKEVLDEYFDKLNHLKHSIQNTNSTINNSTTVVTDATTKLRESSNQITRLLQEHNNFIDMFPTSHYKLALDSKVSELTKAKKIRELEINLFDLYIPLVIGLSSIGLCIKNIM